MKIGVLTGGGDAPGLNAAIKAITYKAAENGIDVYGIKNGYRGLIEVNTDRVHSFFQNNIIERTYQLQIGRTDCDEKNATEIENDCYRRNDLPLIKLDTHNTRTIDRSGGTILGSSRTNPENYKDTATKKKFDASNIAIENIKKLGLEALITIGGEDTLGAAKKLCEKGVNIIGVPKTIDKDLFKTDYTIGFLTAVETVCNELERLRTPAGSHKWVYVLEIMGRDAGHLALHGGRAAQADIILIPEVPVDISKVNKIILEEKRQKSYFLIAVAEGVKLIGEEQITDKEYRDDFGHKKLTGIAPRIAELIQKGTDIETRYCILSHIPRGGSPIALEKIYAERLGTAAVELILKKDYGKVPTINGNYIRAVPISRVAAEESGEKKSNTVDIRKLYDSERYNYKTTALDMPIF